jgi:hypothetical protein
VRRLLGLVILAFAVGAEPDPWLWLAGEGFVAPAEARVGRPATPISVAGTARRTTRRVVRRTGAYISVLPAGCVTVSINGAGYYQCGHTYYEYTGGQYVVIIID